MNIGKCCIDCISCIMANVPMEAGIKYTCINPKGKPYFTDQWDTTCIHFKWDCFKENK
jgi:hypothetical protein